MVRKAAEIVRGASGEIVSANAFVSLHGPVTMRRPSERNRRSCIQISRERGSYPSFNGIDIGLRQVI